MTAQHTQGRLVVREIHGSDVTIATSHRIGSGLLRTDSDSIPVFHNPEDARRLAACWNACIDFDTETLEGADLHESAYKAECRERDLTVERDQLRAELDAMKAQHQQLLVEHSQAARELGSTKADLTAARELLAEVLRIEEAETASLLATGFPADALDLSMTERIRLFLDDTNHLARGGDHLDVILRVAEQVTNVAELVGVVLTIEQRPRMPLAMGNYDTTISVRPALGRY